jgi:hypothetical protein
VRLIVLLYKVESEKDLSFPLDRFIERKIAFFAFILLFLLDWKVSINITKVSLCTL